MNKPETISFEEKVQMATRVPGPSPEFTESLWKQVVRQPRKQPAVYTLFPRNFTRPAWVAVAIALAVFLVIAAVGPQRVLAAFRSLFGYFPGIGFVQNAEAVRRLEEPVQLEREGYVVTVEDLVASEQQTWVKVRVEGWDHVSDDIVTPLRGRDGVPSLLVDDGQWLSPVRSQSYGRSPLTAEYVFPPLPAEIQTVTLALPQLPRTPKGAAPEKWQFTLRLRPAGSGEGLPAALEQDWQSPPSDGLTLSLDHVAQGTDQTVLSVRIESENPRIRPAEDWPARLSLMDESGRIYPLTDENLIETQDELAHALRTRAFHGGERLTLRLDQLLLAESQPPGNGAPNFHFDPGDRPQIGQTWHLDQTLSSERFNIHVTGAELNQDPNGEIRLVFDVEAQPGLEGVRLGCAASLCVGGEGGGLTGGPIKPAVLLEDLPTEPIDIRLDTVYYHAAGPWEIHWQVPTLPLDGSSQSIDTPVPTLSQAPTSTVTSSYLQATPTATYQDPLAVEVQSLIQQGFNALYGQEGWVHVAWEDISPEDTEAYHSGKVGPAHSFGESWKYVEADGTISRYVWLERTVDGTVWRKIARVGKTQVDFFAGTAVEDEELLQKAKPDSLPWYIEVAEQNSGMAFREEVDLEGHPSWLITLSYTNDPPLEVVPFQKLVAGGENKTWIDRESGQILMVQQSRTFEDGSTMITQTFRYHTSERVDAPPQEVLDLLDQVVP